LDIGAVFSGVQSCTIPKGKYMSVSVGEINTAYQGIYRRAPTSTELAFHQANHANHTAMMIWIKSQNHYVNILLPLLRAYEAAFNRKPDSGGLDYWVGQVTGGASLLSVYDTFAATSESQTLYAGAPQPEHFFRAAAASIENRLLSTGDITWYTGLANSGWTRGRFLQSFAESSAGHAKINGALDAWANTASWNPTDPTLYSGQMV
jgi:hypothetical protein